MPRASSRAERGVTTWMLGMVCYRGKEWVQGFIEASANGWRREAAPILPRLRGDHGGARDRVFFQQAQTLAQQSRFRRFPDQAGPAQRPRHGTAAIRHDRQAIVHG